MMNYFVKELQEMIRLIIATKAKKKDFSVNC